MAMYSRTLVKLGKANSGISNGVAQGSTLAPYLFAIYTRSLIRKCRNAKMWVRLYADDIVVLLKDSREVRIVTGLLE